MTNSSTTDGAGGGAIDFPISSATPGYELIVDVTVAGTSHCQSSFTPSRLAGGQLHRLRARTSAIRAIQIPVFR
jgi:hypothetical protein